MSVGAVSNDAEIRTARLRLVAADVGLLEAELRQDGSLFAGLSVRVPAEWPPIGGEHDRDAVEFFRATLLAQPSAFGWLAYFVCLGDELVGSAGYFGPPDETGTAEIGYSVSKTWRRQGLASEAVGGLVERARALGASRLIAHTKPDNFGSIEVLVRNDFLGAKAPTLREGYLRFDLEF